MDTLIINGINWLDPRMIGLKCIFDEHYVGNLTKARLTHTGTWFTPEINHSFNTCRLLQGDKTPYDGKGHCPVPDGVMVKVWWKDEQRTLKATHAAWHKPNVITHYQVMEQKLEEKDPSICPHGKHYIACKEDECFKFMADLEDAAYCSHGFLAGCPACEQEQSKLVNVHSPENINVKAVPVELLERIEVALTCHKSNLEVMVVSSTAFNKDLAKINSILDELKT